MSGIAGILEFGANLAQQVPVLERMLGTLSHRGEDGAGLWAQDAIAMGHRRTVVRDKDGGVQPMVITQGGRTCSVVFDGRITEPERLRQDIGTRHFTTQSDAEVVLRAYLAWGIDCFRRLTGAFALALWDSRAHTLYLARDRLGIKPLFFWQSKERFLFGSEPKAILAHPRLRAVLDEEGATQLMALGPARLPGSTPLSGIQEILPGHYHGVSLQKSWRQCYWQFTSLPHRENLMETAQHLRFLTQEALRVHLEPGMDIGCMISGGLDSSVLALLAQRRLQEAGQSLYTYAVDYRDNAQYFTPSHLEPSQDTPWIGRIQSLLDSRHQTITLTSLELVSSLEEAMRLRDLPGMADIDGALLLLARRMHNEVRIVLSGECADEMLGGYPWFAQSQNQALFPWSQDMARRTQLLQPRLRSRLPLESFAHTCMIQTLSEAPTLEEDSVEEARLRRQTYLNIRWFMACLLERSDRMAPGMEIRLPFCYEPLVEYMWNIPYAMKRARGHEKGILRLAMVGDLPDDLLWRQKSPFPKTHHPDYGETVRQQLAALLRKKEAPLWELVDRKTIREFCSQPLATGKPWYGQLMSGPQLGAMLLQMNAWLVGYDVDIRL